MALYVSQWVPLLWLAAAFALYGAGRGFRALARRALGVATDADLHRLGDMDPVAARHLQRAQRLQRAGLYLLLALPVVSVLAHLLPVR